MAYQQNLSKVVTLFYIIDGDKYLYWRGTLWGKGYYWTDKKSVASHFDRNRCTKIIRYLKSTGFYDVKKVRVK